MTETIQKGQLRQLASRDMILLLRQQHECDRGVTAGGPVWYYLNLTNGLVDWHYENVLLHKTQLVSETEND